MPIDLDGLSEAERAKIITALRRLPPGTPLMDIDWPRILQALRTGIVPVDKSGTVADLLATFDVVERQRIAETARGAAEARKKLTARLAEVAERLDPRGELRAIIKEERASNSRRENERRDAEILAHVQRIKDQLRPWSRP